MVLIWLSLLMILVCMRQRKEGYVLSLIFDKEITWRCTQKWLKARH
jgi:hypothetical protein